MKQEVEFTQDGFKFPYMSEKYGRAEFGFCFKFTRGLLTDVYIDPYNTPVNDKIYHVKLNNARDFSILSWSGLDEPKVWLGGWCKEHKAFYLRVYSPNYATNFSLSKLSSLGIYFGKEAQEFESYSFSSLYKPKNELLWLKF